MNTQHKEKQFLDTFLNELSKDTKESISIEPSFIYKGQKFRLDFISQIDKIYLGKIFKEIEDNKNDKISFTKLKKEAEQEYSEAQKIEKIQAKKYISIQEFQEIYGKSKTSQQGLRGRLKDPIPYRQTVKNGAITYVVEEVEKWFINQHK